MVVLTRMLMTQAPVPDRKRGRFETLGNLTGNSTRNRIWLSALVTAVWVGGCGGRTSILGPPSSPPDAGSPQERCDGRDTDGDGRVDEGFRGDAGLYLSLEHCGACGRGCDSLRSNATEMGCVVRDDVASCSAVACQPGFGLSTTGGCAPLGERLCLPCVDDASCGVLEGARCAPIGGDNRCLTDCRNGCSEGFRCGRDDRGGQVCLPDGGGCVCGEDDRFERACALQDAPDCPGRQACERGRLGPCVPPKEICDGFDNDCDGLTDEAFIGELGSYSDDLHCGACGINCTLDTGTGPELECGGDPFAPTCVVRCPDRRDGVQLGDRLDADGRIDTGCECLVVASEDGVGPGARGQLDENCDGADGDVLASYYVAVDGDDEGPGSPTEPLRTIGEGVRRAAASLSTDAVRRDVYIASGTYTERVVMLDGVRVHGGYRRDFRARDPDGLEVVVVAPADMTVPEGAAILVPNAGHQETLLEGLTVRGGDARGSGLPAIGMIVQQPGPDLTLRDLRIRSGRPSPGSSGASGSTGRPPSGQAVPGQAPRAALEDAAHTCLQTPQNRAMGGTGGRSRCGGTDVSGGAGGASECPRFGVTASAGTLGRGTTAAPGGSGGAGGHHVEGPLTNTPSCTSPPCCGLADFTVPTAFQEPRPGQSGSDGTAGAPGPGCADPLGTFQGARWTGAAAGAGTPGRPGGGGGGGGAGGGALMTWHPGACEFPDGFGGGGGGGGGGGCGGGAGAPGTSGAPAVALLVVVDGDGPMPRMGGLVLATEAGGRGGDGGDGGDGGLGGDGGPGGSTPPGERSTPTLAGPSSGQRGGRGGNGGGGGGGGGGCGGSSVGIWLTGIDPTAIDIERLRAGQTFELAEGGRAGRGGGGAVPAPAGRQGGVFDVVAR